MSKLKIVVASDHAGYNLKSFLISKLNNNYSLQDLGSNNADESVDYPDFSNFVAEKIINKEADFGILICGSGVGVAIAANRFKQVRAAVCSDLEIAKLARKHNNANVLCLGARFTDNDLAFEITKTFLTTSFEGGRHEARVDKLS